MEKQNLILEICKYSPKLPSEIIELKTYSSSVLKKQALQVKTNYYSNDEGDVLSGRLNVIDF